MGLTGLLESTHAVGRESRNLLGSLLFRSLLRVAVCPSVGIPKQRDRSSRRPSIDLLLVERVEGKACLSTKAEPRRCWSTMSLERRTKFCSRRHSSCATRPLRILRRLGRQHRNLGRRVAGIERLASETDPVTRRRSRSRDLKFLGAAGDPKDSGGYKRHGGKNGDQRASGVGKRPAAGESCDHVGAVTE